jgi:hypothetical protein
VVPMNSAKLFNDTVFFLGAGASRHVGCLTSAEMLSDLEKRINQLEDQARKKVFGEIYRFVRACLGFHYSLGGANSGAGSYPVNIEDFVRVLRQVIYRDFVIPGPLIGTWTDRIIKWELTAGAGVFAEFLDFILRLLRTRWTQINQKKLPGLLGPIRKLLVASEIEMHFFTLNYDLVLEQYFNTRGVRLVENGFDGKYWTGNFTDVDAQKESKINLYKLHGSLDWSYNADHEVVELKWPENDDPLIIFGTDSKMHSVTPFLHLIAYFRERLESSRLVVTVGYSFFDPYINNILIDALSHRAERRLLVVDPKYKKNTASDFLQYLARVQLQGPQRGLPNLSKISLEKVRILPLLACDFFKGYLSNDAAGLWEEYERVERGMNPF